MARSRTAKHTQVLRAQVVLAYAEGGFLKAIAHQFPVARTAVRRCAGKALEEGMEATLTDLWPQIAPKALPAC